MESIFLLLNSIQQMESDLEQHLRRVIKHKTIKKGEYLLTAGSYSKEMCFIIKGLLRCYIRKDNKEVVTWLLKEGDVATAVVSFHEGTRSEEAIQALEDTELYYITKEELEEVYDTYEAFNRHGRVLTIQYQLVGRKQYNEMLLLSAKERYQLLEKKSPDLIARVPAKYLASYLRISEYHLSDIKRQLKGGGKNKKHPIL